MPLRAAVLAGACLIAPVGLVVASNVAPPSAAPPVASAQPTPARVAQPAAEDAQVDHTAASESLLGLLLPRESADVAASVAGRVVAVHVRMGDHVRAGQPIATLDARMADADVAAAEAAVRSQEVERALAQSAEEAAREHEARVRALSDHGLAPGEDVERAAQDSEQTRLRSQASRSQLAQKLAQLERLSLERRLMQVQAPFSGVIAARYIDPGAAVSSTGAQPIVRVISEALVLRVALPESRAGRLRPGARLSASSPSTGLEVSARVERVSAEIDPVARIWLVEAAIDDPPSAALLEAAPITAGLEMRITVIDTGDGERP